MSKFIRSMFDNLTKKGRQEQEEKVPAFRAVYIDDTAHRIIRYSDPLDRNFQANLIAMYARSSKH